MPLEAFVFTSNVDGHFQKAGFAAERVFECHGSISHLQCAANCTDDIRPSDELVVDVDEQIRCRSELPRCPRCCNLARPNILMFRDSGWNNWPWNSTGVIRSGETRIVDRRLVIVELGAGLAVPTVRYECETQNGTLIRINPRESETPPDGISIPWPALEALRRMDALMGHNS